MLRVLRFGTRAGAVQCNCLAAFICLMAFAILLLNFQATPAGAGSNTARQLLSGSAPMQAAGGATGGAGPRLEGLQLQTAIRSSRVALMLHIAQLQLGHEKLAACASYTAKFTKQERVNPDELQEAQTMALKLRHAPFSVYMKWEEGGDVGREILFCENQYDNKMLVKMGSGIKKALPAVKVDPQGSMAMAESRHPVTQMGLKFLVEQVLRYRKRDLDLKSGVRWELVTDQKFSGRPCDCFVTEYEAPSVEPVYRKSETFIDRELSVPVCVKNYGWPVKCETSDRKQLDEQTLIEFYAYTDVKMATTLSDADFDRTNGSYRLKR